jgi:LytS/YehU family sensor histidine kinase
MDFSTIGLTLAVMMLATVAGIRRVPTQGRWSLPGLVLLAVGIAALGLAASGATLMLHRGRTDIGLPSAYNLQVLLTQSACMVAALQYMRRAQRNQRSAARLQMERQQLEQQLDAARLRLLQAQVEPHFLFNTLAHLRRLAQTDPQAARAMLADLLDYLGEALPELREAESLLSRELRLVRAYLALHQRRMGETRLRLHFDIEPGLERAKLPSTALLTLAENAIKHGIAPLVTGGQVQVSARRAGEHLLLELADTGRGMGESSGHGTGLATLRARLKALYGDAGQLQLRVNQPRGLIVTLLLPLQLVP